MCITGNLQLCHYWGVKIMFGLSSFVFRKSQMLKSKQILKYVPEDLSKIKMFDYIISNDFDSVPLPEAWLGTTVDKACTSPALIFTSSLQVEILVSCNTVINIFSLRIAVVYYRPAPS